MCLGVPARIVCAPGDNTRRVLLLLICSASFLRGGEGKAATP
jgi:hypothetical protein